MIINKIGHIQNNLYYLGLPESPIFLLDVPEPVIFDGGISCAGNIYVEAIRSILGDRQPATIKKLNEDIATRWSFYQGVESSLLAC